MKVLLIGSGGREHAIAKSLKKSDSVSSLYALPGSAAILKISEQLELNVQNVEKENFENIFTEIVKKEIELVVVGPEAPLVDGFSDYLRERGILVFGPDSKGAKLEGDKVFAKQFLDEFNIPTGGYVEVSNLESLDKAFETFKEMSPYVFKYKDLAGGKGVLVSSSRDEIVEFAKKFGVSDSQTEVVGYLEEPLHGWELSYICLVNETGYEVCPILQDHKRLLNNDEGPNTGGMGAYSPAPVVTDAMHDRIMSEVIEPTVKGMAENGIPYTGFLYAGVMIDAQGTPKVLEFNCRFGDPETQPIMMRLESDFASLCIAGIMGDLDEVEAQWTPQSTVGVVLAAGGYPEAYAKNAVISGIDAANSEMVKVFHAGTAEKDGEVVTSGGRVLCVTALGDSVTDAQKNAYAAVEKISWDNVYYRDDIAYRAVAREAENN
ncbi:MAG: phosphoribosylamine--glycine ligase [Bdellovibrionales bacterium]